MKKRSERSSGAVTDEGDGPRSATTDARAGAATRKPYVRPSVVKRRSLSQATLVGTGGTGGTLAGSGP